MAHFFAAFDIVWVEPFLYGGHLVYLPGGTPGCLECLFDEWRRFRHQIVEQPGRYTAREHGCQSMYVPYAGTDLISFASAATRFLLARGVETREPTLLSWTGDLEQARHEGVALNSEYDAAASFASIVRTIQPAADCPICGKS